MFNFIYGKVSDIIDDKFILENNEIGYEIHSSLNTVQYLKKDSKIKIYTYVNLKEDEIIIFGFKTFEELRAFKLLKTINKIGPKLACSILSFYSIEDLFYYISSQDITKLSKIPGIGKKTAERMALELKEKSVEFIDANNLVKNKSNNKSSYNKDVIEALIALGYSKAESEKAFDLVENKDASVDKLIKLSLKNLF